MNPGRPSGSEQEVFEGYITLGSETCRVEFQAPVGATVAEKDAAFMAALAQQATIEYLAIGTLGKERVA